MTWEIRHGRWEDVLADVAMVDAMITDPPYSSRTHAGHDAGASLANRAGQSWPRSNGNADPCKPRRELSYAYWTPEDVHAFVNDWAGRVRGWWVCLSDSDLCLAWREAYESIGLTGFQPVPIVIPGMTVRMSGDGPSSWAVYANVARPKVLHKWGTLPGAYVVKPGERIHIGGKPINAMGALVRDYTKSGDLVCDPCAGAGTTLIAAFQHGRHAIGAEIDVDAYAVASHNLAGALSQLSLPL